MSDNCIFCKIAAGDLPSAKVFENEHVYAFLDLSQVTEGHTLIVPKVHKRDVFDLDSGTARHFFEAVPLVANAIKAAFAPEGMNLLNNNGALADQSVFHFHMHLIPRYDKKKDGFGSKWVPHDSEYSPEDLKRIAGRISAALENDQK